MESPIPRSGCKNLFISLFQGIRHVIFPSLCHLCDNLLKPEENHFCVYCRANLSIAVESQCLICGAEVGPNLETKSGCVHCQGESWELKKISALGPYKGLLEGAVKKIKFQNHEGLAECLGILLGDRLKKNPLKPDCLVPIPQHWRRWLRRGYNPAASVARLAAQRLGANYLPSALKKIKPTLQQRGLSPTRRRENIKGCFQVHPHTDVKGKRILLIDDVLTTGSTCNEATSEFYKMGATEVSVGVLARATGGVF